MPVCAGGENKLGGLSPPIGTVRPLNLAAAGVEHRRGKNEVQTTVASSTFTPNSLENQIPAFTLAGGSA